MKHKLYNRLLSLALAVGLVAGMLPGVTFAGAVDSDATALQSQVEQIAEPTEEPEANDAPQAEPRAAQNRVTIRYVDSNGNEIKDETTEWINYNDNQSVDVENYAKEISGYTFDYAQVGNDTVTAVKVKSEEILFWTNYTLQYDTGNNHWQDWPSRQGSFSPLVLVYEKNEEPEPTPTPDGDVYITDSILTNGLLNAGVAKKLQEQVASYKWYRSETGAENTWEEVERNRVTGTEYNVNTDGTGLNAALDKYFAEPDDDTVRFYYYVEAFDANGSSLGKSDAYQVPYYDALQNGSFETPEANSWNNQLRNGTPNLYWKTTGIAPAGKEGQDVEIIRYTEEPFGYNSTYAEEVRGAYGNIMKSDRTRGAEDGVQFAELNAEAMGALYQDVLTTPGSTLYWSLAHAARTAGGNNPPDQMQVIIAPAEEVKNITTQSQLLRFIADYPEYVQKPAGSDNEGIIASNQSVWTTYNGTYKVADGQYVTRFFFVSRSAGGEGNSLGNLLDDISFSRNIPEPDEGTGHLKVTKQVVGMDEIPDDYNVVIKVENEHYSIHEEYTFTKSSFTWDSAEQVWKASYVFQNLLVDTNDRRYYSVTEEVSGYSTDDFEFQKDESTTSQNVQVQAGQTVSAELKNVYLQDTSDEYPVRFYLEGVGSGAPNYPFIDDWAKLDAVFSGGFVAIPSANTCVYSDDLVVQNGAHQASDTITGNNAVAQWLNTNNATPNLTVSDIKAALESLVALGNLSEDTVLETVGNTQYTVADILASPEDFELRYTQVAENTDVIREYYKGNRDGNYQKSYHVHLTVVRKPGDLTITKTFEGIDTPPNGFNIQVKDGNELIKTLTLENADSNENGVYTWTITDIPETTYTIIENGTDVTDMVLSAAFDGAASSSGTTATVEVTGGGEKTVAITNTYTPAEQTLTIYKNLSGFANQGQPVFSFKIWDLQTDDVWYYHIDMTDKTPNQDEPVIALTLPAGHKYRVEELSNQNYRFVKLEQDGTVINPLHSRALSIPTGGDITLEKDTELVFYNDPVNSNIPTDGGATENRVEKVDNVIVWKKDPVEYGNDHNDNITPDPDAE